MYKFIFFAMLFMACHQTEYKNPHIVINTQLGNIEVELFPHQAPKTVAAFLSYIDSGFYNKASFYRVLKTEELPTANNTGIIQGGIWQTNPGKKITIRGIEHETTKQSGLTHQSGSISLARTTPGTGNTEFFICIGDQSPLDFGRRGDCLHGARHRARCQADHRPQSRRSGDRRDGSRAARSRSTGHRGCRAR